MSFRRAVVTDAMPGPADLSAREAAAAVRSGRLRAEALLEAYLERIEAIEPRLRAFAYLDPELARAQARAVDKAKKKGTLAGLPIGAKDVIDIAGMPTEGNSAIYLGRYPTKDADCIDAIRKASGVLIGKTVTTEFAGHRAGPTANPYNLAHTPGGSSSGSAAAVAAGLLPIAVGTQIAGSVVRPAAFSGCVGFKATLKSLPFGGVRTLSGELDSLGGFARTPDDLLLLHAVLAGVEDTRPTISRKPRIALVRPPVSTPLQAETESLIDSSIAKLTAASASFERVDLDPVCKDVAAAREVLLTAAGISAFGEEAAAYPDLLSSNFRDRLAIGRSHSPARIAEAEATRVKLIASIDRLLGGYDAILSPAAAGEAPRGLASTGDAEYQRLWTFAGTPCVALPVGLGPNGLPLAIQLVGARGSDRTLLTLAEWAQTHLGRIPAPDLPRPSSIAPMVRRTGLDLDAALTASTIEADRANLDALRRIPRDFGYADEPAHIFRPSRTHG